MKFRHRLAEASGVFHFDCYRAAEHPKDKPRFRTSFDSKTDRDRFITRHDALYHDELLAQKLGLQADSPILGEIVASFLQRYEQDWRKGERDRKTVDYYRKMSRRLLHHLGADTPSHHVTTRVILTYWDTRLDVDHRKVCKVCSSCTTNGELVKKEIKGLGTMFRDFGIPPTWILRRGALKGVKKPKVLIGEEKIVRFIVAMPPTSLQRDFCVVKFGTGIRNEEIYAANVGDANVKTRELEYQLRNKQGEIEHHVTYLNDLVLEVVERHVEGRPKNVPLFVLKGRRLGPSSLRKRFIAASKFATEAWRKENPDAPEIRITSVGQFRHEVAEAVKDRLDRAGVTNAIDIVSSQFGHRSTKTAETHYLIGSRAKKVARSKAFTAEAGEALGELEGR